MGLLKPSQFWLLFVLMLVNWPSRCILPKDYAKILNKVMRHTFFFSFGLETLQFWKAPLIFLSISLTVKFSNAWLNGISELLPWKEMLLAGAREGAVLSPSLREGEPDPKDQWAVPDFSLAATSASRITLSLYAATLAWISSLLAGMRLLRNISTRINSENLLILSMSFIYTPFF